MIFVNLGRFRKKPAKDMTDEAGRLVKQMATEGIKVLSWYWTLGRYDTLVIAEAPDEKAFMKAMLRLGDIVATETMVAVTREEAVKLVE